MLKWMFHQQIRGFERGEDYDASYLHEVLETDLQAFLRFGFATGLGAYRRDLPPEVYYAAQLTASMHADCGPCSQLVVGRALDAGLAPSMVRALIERDESALSVESRLGVRFARTLLSRDPDLEACREAIVERWGKRALLSLAFAVITSQMFPLLKVALGYGHACTRLMVAERDVTVPRLVSDGAA